MTFIKNSKEKFFEKIFKDNIFNNRKNPNNNDWWIELNFSDSSNKNVRYYNSRYIAISRKEVFNLIWKLFKFWLNFKNWK